MANCPMGVWLEAEDVSVNLRETVRLEIRPRFHDRFDLWDLVAVGTDGQAVRVHSGDRDAVEKYRDALGQLAGDPNAPCYLTRGEVEERASQIQY